MAKYGCKVYEHDERVHVYWILLQNRKLKFVGMSEVCRCLTFFTSLYKRFPLTCMRTLFVFVKQKYFAMCSLYTVTNWTEGKHAAKSHEKVVSTTTTLWAFQHFSVHSLRTYVQTMQSVRLFWFDACTFLHLRIWFSLMGYGCKRENEIWKKKCWHSKRRSKRSETFEPLKAVRTIKNIQQQRKHPLAKGLYFVKNVCVTENVPQFVLTFLTMSNRRAPRCRHISKWKYFNELLCLNLASAHLLFAVSEKLILLIRPARFVLNMEILHFGALKTQY